ncbi:MAG: hypothetical protein N2316_02090 [Spirochaetes bacterium]|nr:hypothetical protein [Spirochaetota bacterium]
MNSEINKLFYKVVVNSLNTQQVNYLGSMLDRNFDLNREAGISEIIPIPRQTAAQILLDRFGNNEEDIVKLFAVLLENEGKRFYNRKLTLWGRDEFIALLKKNKWNYDDDLHRFFIDPFYEREINFLRKIRLLDLREKIDVKGIISEIEAISKTMGIQDLEWRITLRLYDIDATSSELIRKIIFLLLTRQNLQIFSSDIFVCLKELIINASKANYKVLFDKHVARKKGISIDSNYKEFLEMFRSEIEENGNANLLALAKKEDRFITITFQSTRESIDVWVSNNQGLTLIEKKRLYQRLMPNELSNDSFMLNESDEFTEGAGLGINLVLRVLRNYSKDPHPLKIVFYPHSLKIGFQLLRVHLLEKLEQRIQ